MLQGGSEQQQILCFPPEGFDTAFFYHVVTAIDSLQKLLAGLDTVFAWALPYWGSQWLHSVVAPVPAMVCSLPETFDIWSFSKNRAAAKSFFLKALIYRLFISPER